MGNNLTGSEDLDILNTYRTIQYPQLGTIKVYESLRNSFMQLRMIHSDQQYRLWVDKVSGIKTRCLSHLLHPIGHQKDKDRKSPSNSILIDYDLYPYLLSAQINSRRQQASPFNQKQLWFLLYSLVQASQEMRNLGLSSSGFIQPKQIFMNKEGEVKVASALSWPDTRIQSIIFRDSKLSYFPPELLSHPYQPNQYKISQIGYQEQSTKPGSYETADSFSIGLTLLSALNLQDYQYLYSSSHNAKAQFQQQQFIRIINQFRKNSQYSQILRATICSLLDLSPEKRIRQTLIQKWIEQYRVSILMKENFVINEPPTEIVRNIQLARSLIEYSMVLSHSVNQK